MKTERSGVSAVKSEIADISNVAKTERSGFTTIIGETSNTSRVAKILIVRLSSLGDIVHTFPMIQDIKDHFPDSTIDWLVDSSFVDLVQINPNINAIIDIPLRSWLKNKLSLIANFIKWKNNLKNIDYDYIIDAQGLFKSAILTKFFRGKVYGLDKNSAREKLATMFYRCKIHTGKNLLAIQKNRLLAAKIFNYSMNVEAVSFGLDSIKPVQRPPNSSLGRSDGIGGDAMKNVEEASNFSDFRMIGVTHTSKYVVFFHATSKDSKKYPSGQWADLAKYLIQKHGLEIILPYGSMRERQESEEIRNFLPEYARMLKIPEAKLSYANLAELINNAAFVFGVDTGLVHLANSLNKKLIAIYTDTNPSKTGVFETPLAKNIGNIGVMPAVDDIIDSFELILKA